MNIVKGEQNGWVAVNYVSKSGRTIVAQLWSIDSKKDRLAMEGERFITSESAWIVKNGRWQPMEAPR
jgi:hypothetical protein